MFYLYYLYLFMYTGVQNDFHMRRCSYRLTVTRRECHMSLCLFSFGHCIACLSPINTQTSDYPFRVVKPFSK
jgi:hypothetical protein